MNQNQNQRQNANFLFVHSKECAVNKAVCDCNGASSMFNVANLNEEIEIILPYDDQERRKKLISIEEEVGVIVRIKNEIAFILPYKKK